jgi:nitrogenase molybdenum-iron protein NifN
MVYKGVRGCIPFLHGSQGCATYIRRYMISHFREPVDIACSSFSEEDAIFGGARNFKVGVGNVITQYEPELIGLATTCLSETIGENMLGMIKEYRDTQPAGAPPLVSASTPSYHGTHMEGFHAAVLSLVKTFAAPTAPETPKTRRLNLFPGFLSSEDLRHLKGILSAFESEATVLPDYSEALDGETWEDYHKIPDGGTSMEEIAACSVARASLELGSTLADPAQKESAARYLEQAHGVERRALPLPIGIHATDALAGTLSELTGRALPAAMEAERGRLIDSLVDGHKYVFGQRVALFGDQDMVIALAGFLSEIGLSVAFCGSGARTGRFEKILREKVQNADGKPLEILEGADHEQMRQAVKRIEPTLIMGSSKAYPIAREMRLPLIRVGFPIHDRIGSQRILHVGYQGAQRLFDEIINTILEHRQDHSQVGYSYQ